MAALILPIYEIDKGGVQWSIPTRATIPKCKEVKNTLSPKFSKPTARPPRTTVKCSHDKNVRSLAKETLGSTLTGRAIRFAAVLWRRGWVDMMAEDDGSRRKKGRVEGVSVPRCKESQTEWKADPGHWSQNGNRRRTCVHQQAHQSGAYGTLLRTYPWPGSAAPCDLDPGPLAFLPPIFLPPQLGCIFVPCFH